MMFVDGRQKKRGERSSLFSILLLEKERGGGGGQFRPICKGRPPKGRFEKCLARWKGRKAQAGLSRNTAGKAVIPPKEAASPVWRERKGRQLRKRLKGEYYVQEFHTFSSGGKGGGKKGEERKVISPKKHALSKGALATKLIAEEGGKRGA